MKLSYKILLSTIIILAAAFGMGGYFFVNYVFHTSMEREIGQAMDESSILQFAFETAALNIPSKYDVLQDKTIEQIGASLEEGGRESSRLLRISDENKNPLYAGDGFAQSREFLEQLEAQTRSYQVIQANGRYYVQTGAVMDALDRILYLETMKDITEVYDERARGFSVYRRLTLLMLAISTVVMFFITAWLTRPVRLLTKATRKVTEGNYDSRAEVVSDDELGQLTRDFNTMAEALEENICKLENEVQAREDFIAAFSHELKTPLTAIIGYADLLRSRKLEDEKHFMSANYIYTEGKRLETMSFRLLDMIVTKRVDIALQTVSVDVLFQYLKEMHGENSRFSFSFCYDAGTVKCEVNLIKSVLLNLSDNACKASPEGGKIIIGGEAVEDGYRFFVKDYGIGIPDSEREKITEAFYMVDKSRARSKNGAGLGLALCKEILKLHGSVLEIESKVGEGSLISFVLPMGEVKENAKKGD